jgi:hypothetical protein
MARCCAWIALWLALASVPAAAQEVSEPEVPRDPTLHEWLGRFPDREDIRACVGARAGEWTIAIDASMSAPRRAVARVRDTATGRAEAVLGRCLELRLRAQLASAPYGWRSRAAGRDEHTFRVLDASAIVRAYLERRRYVWTAEQERAGLAQCVGALPESRFPLRVPIVIHVEGGPFVDWPSPPPAWWIAEEALRSCLSYFLGGVPHIEPLPVAHRFVVEVRRDGTVTVAAPTASTPPP